MIAEQALRMGVLSAVLELRTARSAFVHESWEKIALLLAERGMFSLDFPLAISLDSELRWLDLLQGGSRTEQLQHLVKHVLLVAPPPWLAAVPQGFRRVKGVISEDVMQVLQCANLVHEPIDENAIQWWDTLASIARSEMDLHRLTQGRYAEKLSFEYERALITTEGRDDLQPVWAALEDNTLGYDISSFRFSKNGTASEVFIEVKSTTADSVSFYVTRNEWKRANNALDRYFFQIWMLPDGRLVEIPAINLVPHIPEDSGRGRWQDVHILLGTPTNLDCL